MRIVKIAAIIGLCILIMTCVLDQGSLSINIGDYDYHLSMWNSQNMQDFQIYVSHYSGSYVEEAYVTVLNGISIASDPSYWLENARISSITEFYTLIKHYEKVFTDSYNSGDKSSMVFKVFYNTEYHYPSSITTIYNGRTTQDFKITLMPLEEGILDIDIVDYNYHLAMWNNQHMQDYKLQVIGYYGDFSYESLHIIETFNVSNGIPDNNNPFSLFKNTKTIPEIFSFIKEEEERITNAYNGENRSYLHVEYDEMYHYPTQISSGSDHLFGKYARFEITLTPALCKPHAPLHGSCLNQNKK